MKKKILTKKEKIIKILETVESLKRTHPYGYHSYIISDVSKIELSFINEFIKSGNLDHVFESIELAFLGECYPKLFKNRSGTKGYKLGFSKMQ